MSRTSVRRRRSRTGLAALLPLALAMALLGIAPATAAGSTYLVDGASAACSDSGSGTPAQPYCTISAAMRRPLAPGDTVAVAPATYREQVTMSASGTSGNPVVLQATAPGVMVLGTNDLSAAVWSAAAAPAPATAWQTPYAPPSAPRQVFLADQRLAQASSVTTTGPQDLVLRRGLEDPDRRPGWTEPGRPGVGGGRAVLRREHHWTTRRGSARHQRPWRQLRRDPGDHVEQRRGVRAQR